MKYLVPEKLVLERTRLVDDVERARARLNRHSWDSHNPEDIPIQYRCKYRKPSIESNYNYAQAVSDAEKALINFDRNHPEVTLHI